MSRFWSYVLVFLVSAVPIIELRGAIPMGMTMWNTELIPTFIIAVFGAFLPSPFIILTIRSVLHILENSRFKIFQRYGAWLRRKGERGSKKINASDETERIAALRATGVPKNLKRADILEKRANKELGHFGFWSFLALMIFVSIPLPGTGVWTGSIAAGMLDIRLKNALPAIFIGNLIAGIVMTFVTHGLKSVF